MGKSTTKRGRSKLGSWREIRPNVWQVRVSRGYRADGNQRTASATVYGSEQDAISQAVRMADDMGRSMTLGDPMTLDTYFWAYFLPLKETTTTKANASTYKAHYRAHIAEHFGQWSLCDISNVDIQHWISSLPPQSAPNYVRTMRAILNQAAFDHLINESPMGEGYRYRLPRGRRNMPLPVWGAREVSHALQALQGSQLYALWLVMVGCGLSRSEALALDWEDITWAETLGMDGATHHVAHVSVTRACTATDGMKEPKNDRRYRVIPMQPPFSDALHAVRGSGPICQSRRHTKDGWKYTGKRMSASYVPKRWRELFEEGQPLHNLPFVELGRMRATYSTMMQRAGIDGSIINAMQGRSDNSPVLYAHYLNPGADTFSESATAMSTLLAKAQ